MQFHSRGGGNNWGVIGRKQCAVCYAFYCSHWLCVCQGAVEWCGWMCHKQSRRTVCKIGVSGAKSHDRFSMKTGKKSTHSANWNQHLRSDFPKISGKHHLHLISSILSGLSYFFSSYKQICMIFFFLTSRGRSSAAVERAVPKLKRHLVSAGVSHLHRNIISHPLPEVVGKVHLRLREHFVYDRLRDPALQMAKTKTMLHYAVFFSYTGFNSWIHFSANAA